MFKALNFVLVTSLLLVGCSGDALTKNEIRSNLEIDAKVSVLECMGGVNFIPEPEIASGVYEDMSVIAESLCSAPVEVHKNHSFTEALSNSNGLVLERVRLEFSCMNGEEPQANRVKNLTMECSRVFEKFDAKQR
jgi:hypothetical protein